MEGAGIRKGWNNLGVGQFVAYTTTQSTYDELLHIGMCYENKQLDKTVVIHHYAPTWKNMRLAYRATYFTRVVEGDDITFEPTEHFNLLEVRYAALKMLVELTVDGFVCNGDLTKLDQRGLRLFIPLEATHALCETTRVNPGLSPTSNVLTAIEEVRQ